MFFSPKNVIRHCIAVFHPFAAAVYLIMAALYVYFKMIDKKKSFKWELHIEDEIRRKQRFYRIANLFTDVPHLRKQAKRRAYLDWMLRFIPYELPYIYVNVRRCSYGINRSIQSRYALLFACFLRWGTSVITDVPHLRKQAKRRAYLDWMLRFIPYEQRRTFTYMYGSSYGINRSIQSRYALLFACFLRWGTSVNRFAIL